MKVLLVNSYPNGGAANACIRLHLGLLKIGVSSKLLLVNKPNQEILSSYSFIEFLDAQNKLKLLKQKFKEKYHHQVEVKSKAGLPPVYFNLPTSVYDITEHPQYQEADIVNLHWVARFLDYPSFFRKNRKPVVWTLHDMFPFSGGFHYNLDFPLEEYAKPIRESIAIKQKALLENNITVVAPSQWLMRESQMSSTFGNFPHHHIMYGIDTEVFRPHPREFARDFFGIPREKKVILFVADHVNSKLKGVSYLLEAMQKIHRTDTVLCSVGGKIQEDFIGKMDLSWYQLGRISDEKLMALAYAVADVFVIPSIQDNLPNTVLEALSCGIPVIGFPIGGIPDMVVHGKNGIICENVSSESLCMHIQKVLDQEVCFDQATIREDAVERFGLTVQARKYLHLYEQIINS